MTTYLEILKSQFNNRIKIEERRSGIYQLIAPFYHEDGDMINIYLTQAPDRDKIRICDFGKSLMRLSYIFELDTPNKIDVLNGIINENMAEIDDGNIFIDVAPDHLYNGVMQFSQVIAKVTNLNILGKATVTSLFYDYLDEYIENSLEKFNPKKDYVPLDNNPELKADFCIETKAKPLFLFGIRDDNKAAKVIITCFQFQRNGVNFRSVIINEKFDQLSRFNQAQVMDVCDKQFYTFDSFKANAISYIDKEL